MGKMTHKVLIACEESQTVCKAFRSRGFEAYSCDIKEQSGGHPEWHILGDALKAIEGGQIVTMDGKTHDIGKWDLLIAHPPCTYLSNVATRSFSLRCTAPENVVAQAIEECMREPVTGNKRAVLADLIIIQDYLFGEPMQAQEVPQPMPMQSYSAPPIEQAETYIQTDGGSKFLKAVDGRKADKVWKLIDELVEAVKILHPRMYTTFIDNVQDL